MRLQDQAFIHLDPAFTARRKSGKPPRCAPGNGSWQVWGKTHTGNTTCLGAMGTRAQAERFLAYLISESEIEGYVRFWVEEISDAPDSTTAHRNKGGRGVVIDTSVAACAPLLEFLRWFQQAHGTGPTFEAMVAKTRNAKATIYARLRALARRGQARPPAHTGQRWTVLDQTERAG